MLFLKNCTVGHVPKCAGRFVRKCLVDSNTVFSKELPDKHGAHLTPDVSNNMGVIFFVRHPYTWLRSLFAHRKKKRWNWDNRYAMEKKCQSSRFSEFIENISNNENCVFDYFETYLGKYREHDLRIGKVENVTNDLISFLNYFEEDFEEEKIRATGVHMANKAAKDLEISQDLMDRLYKSQSKFYSEYSYEN